ncbi:glycoside hydrolase domain-containing protein [Granulicoccus phenolivorans]|uniref:glycoside hydrolase domain-containing protein n=1 Tax=Granulicoccus phenolivorans TaxID=266854 RepID=UPI000426276B|nr:glycoside hydrolase domain-containing protein [Granulicoccus phenolivorans]
MTKQGFSVDPFIGCEPTELREQAGLAATWWSPKPQIGNTHPGAGYPFGMVSACAYSGAYPTGYGRFDLATEGVPAALFDSQLASGFTHFQQSGTGAIRKYYNYLRVTPMLDPLDQLGTRWPLHREQAAPGWYAARLGDPAAGAGGIGCELTVGPTSAVHRYTFPAHQQARIVIDFSHGGLTIPYGVTTPLRSHLEVVDATAAAGEIVVEGVPLAAYLDCSAEDWRCQLWYDRRRMPGGTRLDFDAIRPTTLRPFGVIFSGPAEAGRAVELRIGFSLRGIERAEQNLHRDVGVRAGAYADRRAQTEQVWADHLGRVRTESGDPDRDTVFDTALYHSLIKPCVAIDESPWSGEDGPFAFDLCTMWDIYRTQLPLIATIAPERAVEIARALVTVAVEEGNFPIGYRMARGADRFSRQGSALAHTFLAELSVSGVSGIDWELALTMMATDLRRDVGEEFLRHGVAEPITHTLDLAYGYYCTARVAERVGDNSLARELLGYAGRWRNAFDPDGQLLRASTFYEGTRWNYSFRLLHEMSGRIALAGGEHRFVRLLDRFFGFGGRPVRAPGVDPGPEELAAGYRLGRFQGLNNEPDMDAPWAYTYAGRPDRTAEIVRAAVAYRFGTGRGGLPGNDDSGGLSSWYVWAALGLFPVAGQDLFLLHAPQVAYARLDLAGTEVTVEVTDPQPPDPEGATRQIAAVHWRGRPLPQTWLTGADLRRGGTLRIELSEQPTGWGRDVRPPDAFTPTRR